MEDVKTSNLKEEVLQRIEGLIESCTRLKDHAKLTPEAQAELKNDFNHLLAVPGIFRGYSIPTGVVAAIRRDLFDLNLTKEDIQEVAQAILISLFLHFPTMSATTCHSKLAPGDRLRILQGWLTKVCRRKIIDIYKSKQPKPKNFSPIDELAEQGREAKEPTLQTTWYAGHEGWIFARIDKLKLSLPPSLGMVVEEAVQPTDEPQAPPSAKEKRRLRSQINQIKKIIENRENPEGLKSF